MRRLFVLLFTVSALLLGIGGPASAAPSSTNEGAKTLCNLNYIGIGVIHTPDGSYRYGTHDAILPKRGTDYAYCSQGYLGWPHTGGAYIGPGFILDIYAQDQVTFLKSVNGGFSGAWWFPNDQYATYFLRVCQLDTGGYCRPKY